MIVKLKARGIEVLTEFDAKRLEAIAKMRNDAAHRGDFEYEERAVSDALVVWVTQIEE